MAQASRNLRKLRRLKRERTLAFRMAEVALKQRDQARAMANLFAGELEKLNPTKESDLVIKKVEEGTPTETVTIFNVEQDNQTN